MESKTISVQDSFATAVDNATGIPSPIAVWDIPDGREFILNGGKALKAKIDADGGGEIDESSGLAFAKVPPNHPLEYGVLFTDLIRYEPFFNLSYTNQVSDDTTETRRVGFRNTHVSSNNTVRLTDSDKLVLLCDSPDVAKAETSTVSYPVKEV